ncbi:MAG: hypothetical protein L3J51_11500 [Cocleimonas sp.]|nr:hypothetical protein [Cocleimonas sp.]
MVKNVKAILAGVLFIGIAILLMQLIFLLLVVAYNAVASEYSFLKDIRWIFKYLLGIPVLVIIMILGGYITSTIAKTKSILNSIIVGSIVILSMMWSALANSEITISGVIISLAMILAVVFGGGYFKNNN